MLANPVTYSFGDSAATWVSVVLALALEIRVVLWWLRDRGGPSRWLLARKRPVIPTPGANRQGGWGSAQPLRAASQPRGVSRSTSDAGVFGSRFSTSLR